MVFPSWFGYITCSAAAPSTVLRAGWLSYGQCDFSTPHSSAPNEPIKMAFGTRDSSWRPRPLQIFIHLPLSVCPWKGVKYNLCPSLFFCLCFLRQAVCAHESADFHDLRVKWCHFAAESAFWGLELYLTPVGGRLPPKTSPKRPLKGKFKPKLKFRIIQATFDCVFWSSPNFTTMRIKNNADT